MNQTDLFNAGPGAPAEPCAHSEVTVTLTPHLTHYAREDCAQCGQFVRWQPKPATVEKARQNAATVERLASVSLTDWEKGFVLSLAKQGFRLSPKQQETLDRIASEKLP